MRPLCPYKEFDGSEGVSLQKGELTAYVKGECVSSVAPVEQQLEELLSNLSLARLLPEVDFYCGSAESYTVSIDLNDDLVRNDAVVGVIMVNDRAYPWSAERVSDPAFALRDQLPEEWRAGVGSSIRGWAFRLPRQLSEDIIVRKRILFAIEGLLVRIEAGQEVSLPLELSVSTVFSAETLPPLGPLPLEWRNSRVARGDR